MTDIVPPDKRSEMMRGIRSKDTKPERVVRSFLHSKGYRFRLHRRDLPGNPDIVLPKYNTAIFVHGCFWHRHKNCKLAYNPKTNIEKWEKKFKENIQRDQNKLKELKSRAWNIIVIWECEVRSNAFSDNLLDFLNNISKTKYNIN